MFFSVWVFEAAHESMENYVLIRRRETIYILLIQHVMM